MCMGEIWFVFPNVGGVNYKNCRGGLLNRWEKAKKYSFNFVEVPAHFVRDTETEFLGLSLSEKSIRHVVRVILGLNIKCL